jgi:hypothetical protein
MQGTCRCMPDLAAAWGSQALLIALYSNPTHQKQTVGTSKVCGLSYVNAELEDDQSTSDN